MNNMVVIMLLLLLMCWIMSACEAGSYLMIKSKLTSLQGHSKADSETNTHLSPLPSRDNIPEYNANG